MSYFKDKVEEIEYERASREAVGALYDFEKEEGLFGAEEAKMNRRIDYERGRITGWRS